MADAHREQREQPAPVPSAGRVLVEALCDPAAYAALGERPERVEHAETHISHLFFTGTHVYKVKKAVDLGFLDFTTLERRRHFCDEEVRLNRRLSPQVYLGVVPVTERDGHVSLGGDGTVVDYAVRMRQLPREQMLDALLRRGAVSTADVERIAARIAAFHQTAERSAAVTRLGGLESVRARVEEVLDTLPRWVGAHVAADALEDVAAYSRAFMAGREALFREREAGGFVCDGHGDLHAAQICLRGGAQHGMSFIDCIEFDAAYRCGDVASDLAFLAMDLDRYGRRDLSAALVDAYVAATMDGGLRALLPFYACYRACVRAKVAGMRVGLAVLTAETRAQAVDEVRAYVTLARGYALASLPAPALYLVTGLVGTGKTTLARALAARWGMAHYASDVERKRLAGLAPTEHRSVPPEEDIYSPRMNALTYERLHGLAEADLAAGRSVVLDATFLRREHRRQALAVAARHGAAAWVIECVAPEAAIRERLAARAAAGTDASDATAAVYEAQRTRWEPVTEVAAERHVLLRTDAPASGVVLSAVRELFRRALVA